MKKKYFNIFFLFMVLLAWVLFSENGLSVLKHLITHKEYNITVAIDAGHGGFDSGKVGINNALEKDINLSIALKVKSLLEENDIKVIMTRENNKGLYKQSDQDKKRTDMRKRVEIINSCDAFIAISIHQNSYKQESSRGAQVFYYEQSNKGKILAETIQNSMKETIADGNHRMAKSNSSYYMLKQTNCPLVIVECGFLSNWEEANLLCSESYQEKVAWAIHLGIMEYINQNKKDR